MSTALCSLGVWEKENAPTVLANTGYSISAIDIAINSLFALLPVALLWNVQLSTTVKVSVVLLLGLGVLSNIATIMRFKYLVDLSQLKTSLASVEAANVYLPTFVYTRMWEVARTLAENQNS
ncbi:hypothetical protein DL764_009518 [Monosporascus ibericus]|uniref:Rhodopsin domain-containing protein n=1 Tax=Monosporascus ibericus TaxID=155417 RepID=A0A4V1X8Y6_9PEZI|nr:hypothetical protein DL764_009518 [Monosporascus ibericus]